MFALEEIGFERLQLQLGARIESNRYEPKAAVLRLALHHDGEEEGEDEPEPVTLPGRNFTGGSPATPRPAPSLLSNSAAGEFVFHVFGSIAHFERRLISERTRDGIAAARKRGRTPGRPPLDPETVSAAQKLIEAGLSPSRTAKQLGIGRATAYRIAKAVR